MTKKDKPKIEFVSTDEKGVVEFKKYKVATKIGNGCHVLLPSYMEGKEVKIYYLREEKK